MADELSDLVPSVLREIERNPVEPQALRLALERLLVFLSSTAGRTNDNLRAVDLLFCIPEEFGWHDRWNHLPEPLRSIVVDLGHALHDTVDTPWVAEMLESTPERLLTRLRAAPGEETEK